MGHRQLHNQKQYMIPDSISDVHFCLRRSVFMLGQPPILRKYIFFRVRQLKNIEKWLTQDEIYGSGTKNPSKFFWGTDNYTTKSSRRYRTPYLMSISVSNVPYLS